MKLTQREWAAVRSALAAFIANDHDEEEFVDFDIGDALSALDKSPSPAEHGTFRPGDRVRLNGLVSPHPAFLAGERGTIKTMHYGRGPLFGVWYAQVEFDASTKLRTVKLSDLLRA